jgi:hypothetical protein
MQNYNEFSQAWILKTEPVFIGYLTLIITVSFNYFQKHQRTSVLHERTEGSVSNYLTFSFLKAVVIYQNWFFDILRTVIAYCKNRLDNRLAFGVISDKTPAQTWTKPKTIYTHMETQNWTRNYNEFTTLMLKVVCLNSNELYT